MEKNSPNDSGTFSYDEVMQNKAVTNIAGWTEPNSSSECDEQEYRNRLQQNGPIFAKKAEEVFKF